MKRALALCLLLGACASRPPEITTPKVVEVPVAVPCPVELPAKPSYATDEVPLTAGIFDLVKALLITLDQRAEYEAKLEAVANACR